MTARAELPIAHPSEARARMAALLGTRRRGVAVVLALTAASTAANLAGPALVGRIVDAAVERSAPGVVDRAALAYGVLAVLGGLLQYLAGRRAATVGEGCLAELRTEAFDHAVQAPGELIEAAGTGDLVSRVTGDVTVLATALRWSVPIAVFAVVEAMLTLVALVLIDWRLAAVGVIAGVPAAAAGGRRYIRRAPPLYAAERAGHASLAGGLLERYRGRSVLAAHGAGRRHRALAAGLGRAVVDAELRTTRARNHLRPAVSASMAASMTSVIALGAVLVERELATVGAVSAALLYLSRLFDPVSTLLEQADELQQVTAATARLVGITQLPTLGVRPSDAATRPGAVVLDDVSFGYDETTATLRAVTLRLRPGERLAVVGASGAGKSTLAKLVLGTLSPDGGTVSVGGPVAMAAQEGHVFARTLADNVRLARPDASDAEVLSALDGVEATWVSSLPEGIATMVGDDHHHLTPAEAQQVALARVLCADPAVVVLDEATADLAPQSARLVEQHLATVLAGRTVLTIAHRLDTAARSDRILVLDAGTVVADGPHDELAEGDGIYASMWSRWQATRGAMSS